jgi:hypothetical protein
MASSASLTHSPKPIKPAIQKTLRADKKAFKRREAELQAILPLPGTPLRKEGAQFHHLFELSLPKEHWRDSNKDNELGSEED